MKEKNNKYTGGKAGNWLLTKRYRDEIVKYHIKECSCLYDDEKKAFNRLKDSYLDIDKVIDLTERNFDQDEEYVYSKEDIKLLLNAYKYFWLLQSKDVSESPTFNQRLQWKLHQIETIILGSIDEDGHKDVLPKHEHHGIFQIWYE